MQVPSLFWFSRWGRSHLRGRTGQRFIPCQSFFLPPENRLLATQTFDFRKPATVGKKKNDRSQDANLAASKD